MVRSNAALHKFQAISETTFTADQLTDTGKTIMSCEYRLQNDPKPGERNTKPYNQVTTQKPKQQLMKTIT